jgi:5-methylcytosine-specific restriction endonuclease McrA
MGAAVNRPASSAAELDSDSRHIPAAVKRAVWKRDEAKCAFVGANGRRCGSKHQVEYHHQDPYARGGAATVANIFLLCRVHNQHQARIDFGPYARSG